MKKRMKSHVLSPVPHLFPGQSLPQRLVLSAETFVLLLGLPELSLQVLQVLLLLLPRLAGRLTVLYHPLLPLQHLHLHEEEEEDWEEVEEGGGGKRDGGKRGIGRDGNGTEEGRV